MRDGSRLQSLGKVGEIGTQLDEPLKHHGVSNDAQRNNFVGSARTAELTKYAATGRVTRIRPTKNSGAIVGGYLACSLKMW